MFVVVVLFNPVLQPPFGWESTVAVTCLIIETSSCVGPLKSLSSRESVHLVIIIIIIFFLSFWAFKTFFTFNLILKRGTKNERRSFTHSWLECRWCGNCTELCLRYVHGEIRFPSPPLGRFLGKKQKRNGIQSLEWVDIRVKKKVAFFYGICRSNQPIMADSRWDKMFCQDERVFQRTLNYRFQRRFSFSRKWYEGLTQCNHFLYFN